MFTKKDKKYLNNPYYSMASEKFYYNERYIKNDEKKLLNGSDYVNRTVMQAYPFTNEDLNMFFVKTNKKFNSVLTVGSSIDQVLNAIFFGATDITVADANLYTKPYGQYKIAAIKNLEYKEFLKAFKNPFKTFSKNVYKKIFHDLDIESQSFWGSIFIDGFSSMDITLKMLAREDVDYNSLGSCFFNDEESYNKLQQCLRDGNYAINYINAEISDFPKVCKGHYDLIMFSNILKYVKFDNFQKTVNKMYENNLNDGGVIQLDYLYPMSDVSKNDLHMLFGDMFPDKKISRVEKNEKTFPAYFIMEKPPIKESMSDIEIEK